jgi:hypothetical protein
MDTHAEHSIFELQLPALAASMFTLVAGLILSLCEFTFR